MLKGLAENCFPPAPSFTTTESLRRRSRNLGKFGGNLFAQRRIGKNIIGCQRHALRRQNDHVVGPLRSGGSLRDIAPTLLELLALPQPDEMTGRSLIGNTA